QRERSARACGHPGVFTDLKTDPQTAYIKEDIAKRNRFAREQLRLQIHTGRPWLEPSRLVMEPVAGKELLRHESRNLPVYGKACRVEQRVLIEDGQPKRHRHAVRGGQQLVQYPPAHLLHRRGEESVLAAI